MAVSSFFSPIAAREGDVRTKGDTKKKKIKGHHYYVCHAAQPSHVRPLWCVFVSWGNFPKMAVAFLYRNVISAENYFPFRIDEHRTRVDFRPQLRSVPVDTVQLHPTACATCLWSNIRRRRRSRTITCTFIYSD